MPLVIDQPEPDQQFNITAAPAMPTIMCRARITGMAADPTDNTLFDWSIRVVETVERDTCASSRIGDCVLTLERANVCGGRWTAIFDSIQGGDAVITASATVAGELLEASVDVRIRGGNPAVATVTASLGGAGTAAELIARHESHRQQFDAAGMPLLGPGGDVGIMQLCNPAATVAQRWSWTANAAAGRQLLTQKENAARNYLNQHVVNGSYPNNLGLDNAHVLLRETIQRYNGGRYWEWNARARQWRSNPPNDYVRRVLNL